MTSSRTTSRHGYTLSTTDIEQKLASWNAAKAQKIGFWQMANKGLLINNTIITYGMA